MPNMKVSVKAHSESPTKIVAKAREFKMVVDEPKSSGGTNEGANPVEYLLTALAGCINVVGHVVAKEMGIDIKNMEIDLEGDLNPARFMGVSKTERAGFQGIRAKIKVDSDASEETLKNWLETVEDRCQVNDNIAHSTPVKISLV